MSAPSWSDRNAHDPGIAVLVLLVFALGAGLYVARRRARRSDT